MKHQSTKDFSTVSTSGVENSAENVKIVENPKNHVENSITKIPFIVYESAMSRAERHNKRMCIALIIAIIIVFATNGCWLLFISQFDFESYDYSQDGTGVNIIGNENGVDYNGAEVKNTQNDKEE